MTLKKRAVGGVAISASAALVLSACGGGSSDEDEGTAGVNVGYEDCVEDPNGCMAGDPAGGGEVTWGIDGAWSGWFGLRADANESTLTQSTFPMLQGTGVYNPAGEWEYNEGWFAKEPEKTSDDPLTVKYTLKEGAGWSDGTPFSLDDAIFTWHHQAANEEWCTAECQPAGSDWGPNVEDITEADEGKAIEVVYKDGFQHPEWLLQPLFSAPVHWVEEEGGFTDWKTDPEVMGAASKWLNETTPELSNGPYQPTDAKLGEYVIYEPNPEWKGENKPTLDKLTLEAIEGGMGPIVDAQRNGEIHGGSIGAFNIDEVAKLDGSTGINYMVGGSSKWSHIDMNTESEFLADEKMRQAVFTAIKIDDLNSRIYPDMGVERRGSHIFAEDSEYYEDWGKEFNQGLGDVDAAKKILEDAGYELDGDTLKTPEGKAVSLTFRASPDSKRRQQTAEIVQAQLAKIGIEVKIKGFSSNQFSDVLSNAEFDLIVFGWSGSPAFAGAPSQYWRSDSGSNFGKLEVEGLDEVIDNILTTSDSAKAAEYANEADKMATEAAYSLAINTDPNLYLSSDQLVNVRPNPKTQEASLYNVDEWGMKG
ncbi:ABC transporter family substrate-binding protein [Salininema proteolyticum]|uniref:ABC transporter family substrate-binding protein n=1 Tax=Salininema proteolyticum TaxID=1607685 RepID=A0ABV8U2H4_9ACTN